MKITILGCGTSAGVPVPGCHCEICTSTDAKNHRLRASLLIEAPAGQKIIIDTSPDFRQQVLKANLKRVDAVLFTHSHADHIMGLDDLRSFNFLQGPIDCYATGFTWDRIVKIFEYAFFPDPNYVGGGLPKIVQNKFEAFDRIVVAGLEVETFQLMHGNMEVIGFKFGDFAYATDCNFIPERSLEILKGVKTLVLDGLRYKPHPTHFSLSEAQEIARKLGIPRTILTHHSHDVEFYSASSKLQPGVELAYDGMEIALCSK